MALPATPLLPPSSPEAEQGVLGCALLGDSKAVTEMLEQVPPESFYDLRNQAIYNSIAALRLADKPVELISVSQALKDKGMLDQIGGLAYLMTLPNTVPSAANLPYYAEMVREKHALRKVLQLASSVSDRVYSYNGEVATLLDELEKDARAISDSYKTGEHIEENLGRILVDDLERRVALQGKLSGIATGFHPLDRLTNGLQSKELSVIGARPSQGKTAMLMSLAAHAAFRDKTPTLFISLEMPTEALLRRLASMETSVPALNLRSGELVESDFPKLVNFQAKLKSVPIHIHDGSAGMSISRIASLVRHYVERKGIKLVVLDYLTKVHAAERHEKRTYEVGEVSGTLKGLAKDYNIHVCTAAQLNRENVKSETPRPPRLSDLADSGQIERDADLVGLLHREFTEDDPQGQATSLIIAKQRDGELGVIPLHFEGRFCRFEEKHF